MGVVYAAHDPELSRKVALKVLRYETTAENLSPARALLLREARAMAQLAHPNVVTVFDVGNVGDRVYIAMELVEGVTLREWLAAGPRSHREIIATLRAAGSGLAAAHAAGVIHRDFKPDNVLVGNDGRVRVTDFGLARMSPAAPPISAAAEPSATANTGVAGTVAYMAPEQFHGRAADARADQFSFAVALYEALYGRRPERAGAAADRATTKPPASASAVSAPLRQVLARALHENAAQRYPSMAELLAALVPPPRRNRLTVIAIAAMIAAVIAFSIGYVRHLQRAGEQRTELVSWLRGVVPEIRTRLQRAHLLPRHDIRPTRDDVRELMRRVERQLATPAGHGASALGRFVLGEGHRALAEHERALELLESAWNAGERGADIEAALGDVLAAMYERKLGELDVVPADQLAPALRRIEQRYRDPALLHLRMAVASEASSPAIQTQSSYLEARIAFHAGDLETACQRAHAAFAASSSTFYEAGILEAKAHNALASAWLADGRAEQAQARFAVARDVLERVLETARSDEQAWLAYVELIYAQARALGRNELSPELRRRVLDALGAIREINPENWEVLVLETNMHQAEANMAIIQSRDPSAHVELLLAAAREARELGAPRDALDVLVCLGHWSRAVYHGTRGIDPYADYAQAIAACESAAAALPSYDKLASLGAVYSARAHYEAEHGTDPTRSIAISERNLRAALEITNSTNLRHNLGRLWTNLARYHERHGGDPRDAIERALVELRASAAMDATNADAWDAMADALITRARYLRATPADAAAAAREAHAYLDKALAIDPELISPLRNRVALAELDAELRLAAGTAPAVATERMRAGALLLLDRRPNDCFAHRMAARAELLAARWIASRGGDITAHLARATSAAQRARQADPKSAPSWAVSAELELLRITAGGQRAMAQPSAQARLFVAEALAIDPKLTIALALRDTLAQ